MEGISLSEDSPPSSLGHLPDGPWRFDESVTDVFEDMLRRSIPHYEVMRRSVFELGCSFVQPGTAIVDLGCSRGDALAPFVAKFGESNSYVGVEVSQPMLEVARDRFREQIAAGFVRIHDSDLRNAYPEAVASLTLCVLTLQFTPIDHRQRILSDAFSRTAPGGAFILVEKLLGETARLTGIMTERYHEYKAEHGYTVEEIERKRLSLEGVLVPVTARWNVELLRSAGFAQVDCFWRWMNFGGWVAVRDE